MEGRRLNRVAGGANLPPEGRAPVEAVEYERRIQSGPGGFFSSTFEYVILIQTAGLCNTDFVFRFVEIREMTELLPDTKSQNLFLSR